MSKSSRKDYLNIILNKALCGNRLEKEEIMFLLKLVNNNDREQLFKAAREVRARYFSDRVFLYGFIYFSTYCRNDCAFCYYRKSNLITGRYRKTSDQVKETAQKLAESGVHLLDLTMGEDPLYFNTGQFEGLLNTTELVKKATGLPVMISPGAIPRDILIDFKNIGVDWYACYQETHNRKLYERLRLEQSYDERLNLKKYAREIGLLIEEGLLAGIGESIEDIYNSFVVMKQIDANQVRVMSFVPQKGTPLEVYQVAKNDYELLIIAVLRLLFPDRLIPASLDVEGINGLKKRLNAGANVVTSIIPSEDGLLGVSQSTLDIEEGGRTVAGIIPVLEQCDLQPATLQQYFTWIKSAKHNPGNDQVTSDNHLDSSYK
ncbi:MAG: methylornithine synthase PylB [Bacillota bacterium]